MRALPALALAACVLPTGPNAHGVLELAPHAEYSAWATELLTCMGRPGDGAAVVASVRWFSATAIDPDGEDVTLGLYFGGSIYLRHGQQWSRRVVKHELLHFLLPGHDSGHKSPLWACEWL